MSRLFKFLGAVFLLLVAAGLIYGVSGYFDALSDADGLALRADALVAEGRGGKDLGEDRLETLLMVQDPAFHQHAGVDVTTPGAGVTTVTQSLAKRVGFREFKPGIGKIRQTGYAIGLERKLTKDQIMALWLDTLEMGRGPDGWMKGFFVASQAIYQRPPAELTEREFLSLVAVLIAPGTYDLRREDAQLQERIARVEKLVSGECTPSGNGDVWLEGCRSE
ncbi:transglycosylase domain-containing protein [Labrenzia sp. OB1]|uniref:transglycosylase domain-containing protein n=1 Tax=Labrenzia sp. OB1 TaxID=1561204 RepID=UPI0007B18683|nr:transglycosylase domain-containing protein [Labrenzia sp. OB1]KZM47991.1 glycosyl transferase [Labrenzia sp. OB1]